MRVNVCVSTRVLVCVRMCVCVQVHVRNRNARQSAHTFFEAPLPCPLGVRTRALRQ